jgi:hypothetical protein
MVIALYVLGFAEPRDDDERDRMNDAARIFDASLVKMGQLVGILVAKTFAFAALSYIPF